MKPFEENTFSISTYVGAASDREEPSPGAVLDGPLESSMDDEDIWGTEPVHDSTRSVSSSRGGASSRRSSRRPSGAWMADASPASMIDLGGEASRNTTGAGRRSSFILSETASCEQIRASRVQL